MTFRSQLVHAAMLVALSAGAVAHAQGPMGGSPMGGVGGFPGGGNPGSFPRGDRGPGGPRFPGNGDPGSHSTMRGGLQVGPPGRWWDDKRFAQDVGVQPDQKARMDAIFEANRPTLSTLFRNLRKEEEALHPLVAAEQPDENRILSQIDRVAQARAELEKANARMLLGIRRELTADQWKKLESHRGGPPPDQNNN